jgi:hypothetical protein
MNQGITRSIFRWIHIVLAIPILGYIYSPFAIVPSHLFLKVRRNYDKHDPFKQTA